MSSATTASDGWPTHPPRERCARSGVGHGLLDVALAAGGFVRGGRHVHPLAHEEAKILNR
jgi:hypothetical protein